MKRTVRLILFLIAVLLVSPLAAHATTIAVGASQSITTLAAAIAAASNGDTLLIDDGVYAGGVTVNKLLTFQAVNIGGAIIEGGDATFGAVITVAADSTFIGLTLRNASRGYFERNTSVDGVIENSVVYGVSTPVSLDNSGGIGGQFDVYQSTFSGFTSAVNINDGGTVNIRNSILANGTNAYVATDFVAINPDHNLLFNVGTVAINTPIGHLGVIGVDPAQIIADPLFINAAGFNFRLLPGSPAIDSGADIGFAFQGAAPDRGAFETVPEPSSITLLGWGALVASLSRSVAGRARRRTAPRPA